MEDGRIYHDNQSSIQEAHHALCDLLQAGMVCKVYKSHFRTDVDNRTEAERITRPIEEYKASRKTEREALWEAAIQETLKEWKYGPATEVADIANLRKSSKRPLEILEPISPNKRLKTEIPLSANGRIDDHYGNSVVHAGYLRV